MIVSRARSTLLVVVGVTLVLGAQSADSGSRREAFDPSAASGDVGYALALQRDGGIVLAGISRRGGREVFAVVRYRRSGAVDPSFGAHGIVLTAPANGPAAARAVAAQDDGRLVVAGDASVTERQSVFALARYTRSGKLDATFGDSGAVLTAFAAPPLPGKFALASAEDLALQRDGRIVVLGGTSNIVDRTQVAVARYTATGALDRSFGQSGKVVERGSAGAVALQRDGKIVVAGTTLVRVGSLSESRFALERLPVAVLWISTSAAAGRSWRLRSATGTERQTSRSRKTARSLSSARSILPCVTASSGLPASCRAVSSTPASATAGRS